MSTRPRFHALLSGNISLLSGTPGAHTRLYRRYGTLGRCCNELGFKLKPILVGFIALYYLYIDGVQRNNNRWKDDREFCYAELGTCDSPYKEYGVISKATPVCYSLSSGGVKHLCGSSNNDVLSCMEQHNYTEKDLLTVYSSTNTGDYFLHHTAILIVACVVLVFSMLFDGVDNRDVYVDEDEGAFYQRDNLNMKRLTNMLEWVLVFLIIWSAITFNLIQKVYCPLDPTKNDDGGVIHTMCSNLGACGAGVRSVIAPSNPGIRYYTYIAYCFAILLIGTMVLRLYLGSKSARIDAALGTTTIPSEEELEAMERAEAAELSQLSVRQLMEAYDQQVRQHEAVFGSSREQPLISPSGRQRTVSHRGFIFSATHFVADADPFAQYLPHRGSDGDHWSESDSSSSSDSSEEIGDESEPNMRGAASVHPSELSAEPAVNADSPHANMLMRRHIDSMSARQQLVKRWEYFDVLSVEKEPALLVKISQQCECSICLCDLLPEKEGGAIDNLVVVRVPCSHFFHRNCLMTWIVTAQSNGGISCTTCPICRASLSNGRQATGLSAQEAQLADRIVEFDDL